MDLYKSFLLKSVISICFIAVPETQVCKNTGPDPLQVQKLTPTLTGLEL